MSSGGDIIRAVAPIAAMAVATYFLGPAGAGLSAGWVAAGAGAAGIAASMAVNAIMPVAKPDLSFDFDFGDFNTEQTRVVKQSIVYRRIVYGNCRVGGVYTFIESTKEATASGEEQIAGNTYLHMLITVAGHPVDSFEDIYIFDDIETFDPATHVSTGPNYTNLAWCWTGDGTTAGDADLLAALSAACPSTWTAAHKQEGCAKVYLRWKWSSGAYTAGLPQPSFVLRGKKVYDPRTEGAAYSANAILCLRDYLNSPLGLNVATAKLPATEWSAEANICDEDVALDAGGTEHRYECNGVVDLGTSPKKIIQALLTACAGRLIYTGGEWIPYVGAYRTPTITLTLDDLDGPIKIASRISRRDLFNGVKGTYVDPDQAWQATDFPAVQVAAYVTEDNEEALWKDIAMAYTTSGSMAQRIARVELERGRRQITVTLSCKLSAYRCMTAETVMLTVPRYGWSAKVFEVMSWGFTLRTDGNDAPRLGIDLTLRETDSGVFSWSTAQEQAINVAAATNLPNPHTAAAPTSLTLASGTDQLFTRLDGTIFSRIRVTWTAPDDAFVTEGGGCIEIQYKKSADADWIDASSVPGDSTETWILDVKDGTAYDVRARGVNSIGARSAWVAATDHVVAGKSALPSNVAGLVVWQEATSNLVNYRWPLIADMDRDGYTLRYGPYADAAANFDSWNLITSAERGTTATNAALPPGSWRVGIKARDTSGNESALAAFVDIEVENRNDVIFSVAQHPAWAGSSAGFLVHPVNARLVPHSTITAGAAGAACFDEFVPSPVSDASYTAPAVDVGFDARLRVWADIKGALGPGETGSLNTVLQVRHRTGAGAWCAWKDWTVGEVDARHVQGRVVHDTATGVGYVDEFTFVVDAPEREESGAVDTAATGGSVVFSTSFHAAPNVWGVASNAGNRVGFSPVSNGGFSYSIYDRATENPASDKLAWWRAKGA